MRKLKTNNKNFILNPVVEKITILNPQDFIIPDFIKELSKKFKLDSDFFGIANSEEVKGRLEVMKMLSKFKHSDRLEEYMKFFQNSISLPANEDNFLQYYSLSQNPFWDNAKKLVELMKPFRDVKRINDFCSYIEENYPYENQEFEFSKVVSEKLNNVSFIEGIIKISKDYHGTCNHLKGGTVGKKMYRSSWSSNFVANVPTWTRSGTMKILGIKKLSQKIANSVAVIIANKSAVITETPEPILEDIIQHVRDKTFPTGEYDIKFTYGKNGLELEFLWVSSYYGHDVKKRFKYEDFEGFSSQERRKIVKASKRMRNLYSVSETMRRAKPIYDELTKSKNLFSSPIKIESTITNKSFKWYALQNIYAENKKIVKTLEEIREVVYINVAALTKMYAIYDYMKRYAKIRNIDICVPELTPALTGTNFKNLAPIDILHHTHIKKIVPFTLPTINGRIVCLTGRHGGGKSVAGKSILTSVWMAQAGLPIFAKEFKTELKTVIGAIVNDEGEGSTATVFVEKVKVLLGGINKVSKGESIIFIDEIGKGTQEEAGINLGKRILKTMKDKEYSVIFNSQILRLAEYAQLSLDAKCFMVDKHHQFIKGIGGGQMEELIKEKGLDSFLK